MTLKYLTLNPWQVGSYI